MDTSRLKTGYILRFFKEALIRLNRCLPQIVEEIIFIGENSMRELPTDGTIYRLPPLQRYSIFLVTLGVIAFLWILMLFTVSSSSSKPETVAFLYKLMGGISLICLVVGILANLTTIG